MCQPQLIFVVGLTASGKTEHALALAEAKKAVILSCDSLCVYKGMDIGTAKPTTEEQQRVPHYGLDISDPSQTYSVADYIAYRDGILAEMRDRGCPVIVAGGSGFYLKSFFSAVVDAVQIPEPVEAEVRSILAMEDGLRRACRWLRELHGPEERFDGLDWNNPRRVARALSRTLASGRSYTELRESFLNEPEPLADWRKKIFLIQRPEAVMEARNRSRVAGMLEAGLIDEVRRLRDNGFEKNPMACGSIGYAEGLSYLKGELSADEMRERIEVRTRQLMRKQRNWFRYHLPQGEIIQFDYD